MAQRQRHVLLLGLAVMTAACYPGDGVTNVEQVDVVITTHDEDVDFASYQTYAMPDTVVHITNGDDDSGIVNLPRAYDDLILDEVAQNMADAGYTRLTGAAAVDADLVLLVGAIGTSRTEWFVSGGWWGWWGYYPGYPGWGWGWPPYYGSVTIEQGSIFMFMLAPSTSGAEHANLVWSAAARGLLGYAMPQSRIVSSINQMFTQSPYLGT